jgi:hypothetical protein
MTQAATLAAAASSGFRRNRIHNGNFICDHRLNGAGTALVFNGSYIGDRWGASKGNLNVGDVGTRYAMPAGAPFPYGLVYSITTGVAPAAGDFNAFYQNIEASDMGDLRWGTAAAKPVTLSFDIYTPLAGVYAFRMCNPAFNRSYVTTYTVAAANTWQRCFVTIPGDVAGGWPALTEKWRVDWDMGSGTNYNAAAANVWGAGNFTRIAGTVNFASAARMLYVTNVQLEAGTIVTPFEYRSMAEVTLLCQRWYRRISLHLTTGYNAAGGAIYSAVPLFPPMRAAPVLTLANAAVSNCTVAVNNVSDYNRLATYANIGATGMGYSQDNIQLDCEAV